MSASADGSPVEAPGGHVPVMLREVLEVLAPRDGAIYVDATFGAGGYATAILDAAECRVWGIDRDPQAVARAAGLVRRYTGRLTVIAGRFGAMHRLLCGHGVDTVDGVALDLGVSSMQLDAPERGFSFRADGPLDMRMECEGGPSAAEVINALSESELADLIRRYGEERRARQVARAIVGARRERPIERTVQLAEIVRKAVGRRAKGGGGIDPATRTFQALRIHVNDEMGELERGLRGAERLLAPGGRLAVVAFHSLEDRIVKTFLKERSGAGPRGPRHLPEEAGATRRSPTFEPLFRGACRPSRAERDANPRARSARLRAARRTAAPAWQTEMEAACGPRNAP
ncbi:MAG: 16S rRNA (cytosine(1402)-N(4))-methyltransferase RsmH [Kiloniellaceae bacterium]